MVFHAPWIDFFQKKSHICFVRGYLKVVAIMKIGQVRLSSPVVLVGSFVWGRMEAFALEENDDLGDDEHDYYQTDE
jgi:hypothetical protein